MAHQLHMYFFKLLSEYAMELKDGAVSDVHSGENVIGSDELEPPAVNVVG